MNRRIALHLQSNHGHSNLQVCDTLHALTTKGIVTSSETAINRLLFTSH